MQKKDTHPVYDSEEIRRLYAADKYISYSELSLVKSSLPPWWSLIDALFTNYSTFINAYNTRKLLKECCSEAARKKHNDRVIVHAQQKGYEIEGRALDKQQIEAVVITEDAQLVMAAAGSGKTLSLLAKCKYLTEELKIPAHRILTISFTNSSVAELAARLKGLGIEVDGKTFHALGNAILGKGSYKIITTNDQQQIFKHILDEKLKDDEGFARRYNNYLLHYFSMPSLPINARSLEELVRSNRSFQTYTLKGVSLDKQNYDTHRDTYHGEKVRSKEEQIIANFLFINNIPYEYEKPFPGYANYKPDFTITKYGEPIYLEHQGVDKQGRTRKDIDWKYYHQKMKWNRQYHKDGGTRLIETYSYEFQEGTILRNLEKRLKAQGVEIIRRQESEILTLIKNTYGFDVKKFNELFMTYLGLLKTSEFTLNDVRQKLKNINNPYQAARSKAFLSLFEEIFEAYEAALRASNSIDFSDMIIRATDKLPTIPAGTLEYDYILVDEVQDLSHARYLLLKAILDRVPTSKLFAVGDDWQSIFRFAGSDLTLLNDFEERFKRHTYRSTIEQTHRFNNPLLDITSSFIKKNPSQVPKNPYSKVNIESKLKINTSATRDSDTSALGNELQALVDKYGADEMSKSSIFLIGRYKKDLLRLDNTADPRMQFRLLDTFGKKIEWTDSRSGLRLELNFMTMHAAKGHTCDFAFILNGNGGTMGVPSEHDDDPVVHMLLAHEDSFPNAEERRLFYVAMTRARISTTIIATENNLSPFVEELELVLNRPTELAQQRCPNCHSGRLILRNGPHGDFQGCTNFGYGCSYMDVKNFRTLLKK